MKHLSHIVQSACIGFAGFAAPSVNAERVSRRVGASQVIRAKVGARGFTLIEVLVAMTILAVGVSALVSASGASTFQASKLREREVGRWVAANHLNTLQALPTWPDLGTKNTEVEMAKQTWFIRTRTKNEELGLRRMDIEVRLDVDAEAYIYSVTGFAGDPKHRF